MTDKIVFEMDLAAAARAIKKDVGFTGGHINRFEKIGRHTFDTALALGLASGHKLLDFGAGALRLGYWFVRFLDAGNYYAIEPCAERLEGGKTHLLGPDILREKAPTFHVSDKCDMTAFGVPFDFVIARSILTHTHPGMLHQILEEFSRCAAPHGIMLASYWALDGEYAYKKFGETGDKLSRDDSGFGGTIKYSLAYLKAAALEYGLGAEDFVVSAPLNQQIWVTFRALPSH
jgi:hypothetical protein